MGRENRRHTRARVKWPVSIKAPTGIVDGTTENLSLSGAFIRLSRQLNSSAEIPLVINAKGRFIPCTAQVVWSDERNLSDQRKFLGIGFALKVPGISILFRFTHLLIFNKPPPTECGWLVGFFFLPYSTSLVVRYLLDREPSLSGAPSRRGRFFLGTLFLISVI